MITRFPILAAVLLSGSAYADDYMLVTSSSNAAVKVSKADLKEMILGKQKAWKGGGIVHLVMQSDDSKSTEWVSSQIFGVGAKTLITKIRQEVFKGELAKPVMCANDNECLEQAKSIGGSLTFVNATTKLPDGVKQVTIEGERLATKPEGKLEIDSDPTAAYRRAEARARLLASADGMHP